MHSRGIDALDVIRDGVDGDCILASCGPRRRCQALKIRTEKDLVTFDRRLRLGIAQADDPRVDRLTIARDGREQEAVAIGAELSAKLTD